MPTCPRCGSTFEGDVCPTCQELVDQSTTTFTPVTPGPSQTPPVISAHGKLSLTVVKGPQIGDYFTLESPHTKIGRDPVADIFLNDRTVSRDHAEIIVTDTAVILKDKGSLNGTYLNGKLVDEAELLSGEVLQIGTFQLQFLKG